MPTATVGMITKQHARPPMGMHCGGPLPSSRLAGGAVGAVTEGAEAVESDKGAVETCLDTF